MHPVKQAKESFDLSLLESNEKKEVLNRISTYNKIIEDPEKLKSEWNKYPESKYQSYLNYWSPLSFIKNRYIKAILNKLGIRMINKKGMSYSLNLMRCEAHADLSREVIRRYL